MNVITLTTDFGYEDSYVAAMKGVILTINPRAIIVDVTHAVPPQNVQAGAFALMGAAPYFAKGTVHVAVVDPGVGTERRAIAMQSAGQFFVGPDNGVLTLAAQAHNLRRKLALVRLSSTIKAVHLLNAAYWLTEVSSTFHGRDIFAPVAAHLSNGEPLDNFGLPIEDYALIELTSPTERDDALLGEIMYVDRFGNLITNVPLALVPDLFDLPQVKALFPGTGRVVRQRRHFFAEGGNGGESAGGALPFIYGDSSGYVGIAVQNGSAAQVLGVGYGASITFVMYTR